jgi:disulfide bond formation protein DsbB
MTMVKWERDLNALIVIILSGILLGAFGVQFIMHEKPCPLCLLQRLGMIGVATGMLLNMWFGVRMSHYALALLSALMGGFVALRQISLHVCPGFPEFGLPVLGLSLYTWSFIVFVCVVLAVALLLFLYDPKESQEAPPPANSWSKLAFGLIFFVAVANIVTTLMQCGLGPCAD